jgi:arginine repressor
MDMNKVVAYIQIQIQIQIRYNLEKQQLNYGEITLSRMLRHTRLEKHSGLWYAP